MLLEEFIVDIKNSKRDSFKKEFIYTYLNIFTKREIWAYIIRLLISDNQGFLTKEYFLEKLMTLKRLMDRNIGYQILDLEKRQIYFLKYPEDKFDYMRGLIK